MKWVSVSHAALSGFFLRNARKDTVSVSICPMWTPPLLDLNPLELSTAKNGGTTAVIAHHFDHLLILVSI